MPEHDGLMRIFWPVDIPKSDSPGIIVGWRNSGLDVFVVAILEDVDVSKQFCLGEIFTDVMLGAERGECPEGWDFISKCEPPNIADIRALWAVIHVCFGLDEYP